MAKTLVEFRAEKGLYLKDVAEAINVPEEELSKIEALNGTPEYIAEKLIVAYNLPENYFSGEKSEQPIKPIKNLKSYFFKTQKEQMKIRIFRISFALFVIFLCNYLAIVACDGLSDQPRLRALSISRRAFASSAEIVIPLPIFS